MPSNPLKPNFSRRAVIASLGMATLSGCTGSAMNFPLTKENQNHLESRNISVTRINSENIRLYSDTNRGSVTSIQSNPPRDPSTYSYFVGPGDELRVQTWSSPERKNLSESSSIPNGPTVNEKGEFFHPFVGMVTARGKTVTQIQQGLEQSLVQYIADPQVEVDVHTFRAHSVTLVGEVESPGSTVLTNVPLRLLDIINTAGPTQISDLRRVEVRRKGTTYTTNLRSFVDHGVPGHNPILLPDDLVYVPIIEDNKVFVFGEIETGEVVLGAGRRSLTEILAAQGGIDRTRADARGVFVFRRPPGQLDGFNVYQFDLSDASALMLTSQFNMAPMDVVFVTTDPISRWNDTVGKLISPVTGVVRAKAIVNAFES